MEGHTYGSALWGSYTVTDWWRLSAGFNVLRESLKPKAGSLDVQGIQQAGRSRSPA